jgi:hypothetical protein
MRDKQSEECRGKREVRSGKRDEGGGKREERRWVRTETRVNNLGKQWIAWCVWRMGSLRREEKGMNSYPRFCLP